MQNRRQALQQGAWLAGLLAATGLFPQFALADVNHRAFDAKNLADAYKGLGITAPVESKSVVLQAPDIAENGAVVPVGISTTLPNVKQVLLLVEKNPTTVVATFQMTDSVEPNITTRTKMGQTSDIYAIVQTQDGKVYYAKKEVKVTLGGCGG